VRFKGLGELLGKGAVYASVKISVGAQSQDNPNVDQTKSDAQTDINAYALDLFKALDRRIKCMRRVEPAKLTSRN